MFIIRMDKNTNLYAISPKKLYLGESHADIIQFVIPPVVGVYDLSILMPIFHYINVDGLDKTAELHYADNYKDQLSFVTTPTEDMMTHGGPYPIWLEWVDQDYNFVFKSGSMHLHIETTIPENDREDIDYNEAADLTHRIEQLDKEFDDVTDGLLERILKLEEEMANTSKGQPDWDEDDETQPGYIKNKPDECDALKLLIDNDMLPAVTTNGQILTDATGRILLRY